MSRFPSLDRARKAVKEPVREPKMYPPREAPDVERFRKLNPVIALSSSREDWVLRKFGLSRERYAEMFTVQRGVCAICGRKQRRELAIDHCHKTGKVRGLLCGSCNTALGSFGDDPDRLRKAIEYLER